MTSDRLRIATVRNWFEIDPARTRRLQRARRMSDEASAARRALPAQGQILLVTGPSGSGKTTLLRSLQKSAAGSGDCREWIDINALRLPNRALVNCLREEELQAAIRALAAVGLAEGLLLLKKPVLLSEGQQFRLRVAMALEVARRSKRRCLLVCDEFAAPLDDVTGAAVAMTLRRAISREAGHGMILATGREALAGALAPDRVARCDFGRVEVTTSTNPLK